MFNVTLSPAVLSQNVFWYSHHSLLSFSATSAPTYLWMHMDYTTISYTTWSTEQDVKQHHLWLDDHAGKIFYFIGCCQSSCFVTNPCSAFLLALTVHRPFFLHPWIYGAVHYETWTLCLFVLDPTVAGSSPLKCRQRSSLPHSSKSQNQNQYKTN
jgi:hypothetical protein